MSLYLDASCIVPLFTDEPSSPAVAVLVETAGEVIVSDFGVGETCSAISRKFRENLLTESQAMLIFEKVDRWTAFAVRKIETSAADVRRAMALVRRFELKLRFPDALQLAAAERIDSKFLTRDRLMADAASVLSLPCELLP